MNRRIKKPLKLKPRKKKAHKEKWEEVREKLYRLFAEAGIQSCELKWENCKGSAFKSFAHSLRRAKIDMYTGKDHALKMREVIWACTQCHQQLDKFEHEVTYEIVRNVIKKRKQEVRHEF